MSMEDKDKNNSRAYQAVEAYRTTGTSTDILGSYTGVVHNFPNPSEKVKGGKIYMRPEEYEVPVQDQDDL